MSERFYRKRTFPREIVILLLVEAECQEKEFDWKEKDFDCRFLRTEPNSAKHTIKTLLLHGYTKAVVTNPIQQALQSEAWRESIAS
jgi:hypothetical protein